MAAGQLAENKDKAAIPYMENELAAETEIGTKINVAAALGQLGDPLGIAALRKVCADTGIRLYERLDAVRHLLFLHEEACATTVIEALSDDGEEPLTNRRNALSLLVEYQHINADDAEKARLITEKLLMDSNETIRFEASDALGKLGNRVSIPALQTAMLSEPVERIRTQMIINLAKLKNDPGGRRD